LAALEDDFLKLSLLLADKIVRKVVEEDISWLEPIIREALTALGQVDDILVRLHPNDYAVISGNPDLMTIATRTRIRFDSDVTIAQGGCLIESENGLIDARLEKRLGKIGKQLLEVLYDENA
jgi:flagellar biosynthesis/type III secretory pathway protein FliH